MHALKQAEKVSKFESEGARALNSLLKAQIYEDMEKPSKSKAWSRRKGVSKLWGWSVPTTTEGKKHYADALKVCLSAKLRKNFVKKLQLLLLLGSEKGISNF